MTNFRHLTSGPVNTSGVQADQSQLVSSDSGNVDVSKSLSHLSELEQARGQMRGQNDSNRQTLADLKDDSQEGTNNVSTLQNSYEDTMRQVFEQDYTSNNSSSNADRLRSEARNLQAEARGRSPGIATQLRDEARRKEVQALQEERNAQEALFRSQELQRKASSILNELQDAKSNVNKIQQNQSNLKNDFNNSASNLSDTESRLDNPPPGVDGGETPQPIIRPSQPAGIDGGKTPQPIIRPSQPAGIDGGNTPQPQIKPALPISIDGDENADSQNDPKKPSHLRGGDRSIYLKYTLTDSSTLQPFTTQAAPGGISGGAGVTAARAQGVNNQGLAQGLGQGQGIFTIPGGQTIDPSTLTSGNSYLEAARALLRAILLVTLQARDPNPIVQIAKNLTNKSLSEQAVTYLETALVDSAIQGSPVNQQIILTKAQANTIHGEAETSIAYWKEVLNENKQLGKETNDLAKKA